MNVNTRKFKIFLLVFFLFPILLFLKIIYPFFRVHFGAITTDRIGRYSIEYAVSYCINKNKKINEINLFYLRNNSSNFFFNSLVKRNLIVISIIKYFYIANKYMFNSNQLDFNKKYFVTNRDDLGILYKNNFKLDFTKNEFRIFSSFLKKIACEQSKKIICIVVRDNKYLETVEPNRDWSYHHHRNSDINNYSKTIRWLCDNGYFVIRMGKFTENNFNFKHNNFYDYSQSHLKSDLLDIMLFANCHLCISTGTGIDFISLINKKPIFFNNYIPVNQFISFSNCYTLPKKLFWQKSNQELTLTEYLQYNFNSSHDFKDNGIIPIELLDNEILIDLKGYLNILDKKIINTYSQHNDIFFKMLINNYKKSKNNIDFNFFHPNAFVSKSWYSRVSR